MRVILWRVVFLVALSAAGAAPPALACTSLLVTPGASADGASIITYSCDGVFHPILSHHPAADHEPGSTRAIREWDGTVRGEVPEMPHTYAYTRLMNEHQVAIGETTFDGRMELQNKKALLHYWLLMQLALERAKTAREAVDVITSLAGKYGYRSTGESFSIADPNEAWILEMIGCGEDCTGAVWVARRLPDGMISAHANMARIGEFPRDDPDNCLYSDNVISLAVERGYYDPASGAPFNFREAYDPADAGKKRNTATRVWSLYRRAAPSRHFSSDFHRGVPGAKDYPLWIRPDEKLTLADVMALLRDHYEGTDLDMTKGVDAGPFGNPNRWRPLSWTVDSTRYGWERPISTQQTGFSMIAEARRGLPDPVGGVLWYGVDDTYTTCWFPLYCGVDEVPESFATGSLDRFSWDSAFWVFNLVANYAGLKYSYMIQDIQTVQRELEGDFLAMQPSVEKTAVDLYRTDPAAARRFLTAYSVAAGERVTRRWRKLAEHLITKYNDGYVREDGHSRAVGYPESWLRTVVKLRPKQFLLEPAHRDTTGENLPY